MPSRRRFLLAWAAAWSGRILRADQVSRAETEAVTAGRRFLLGLFDADLGLLPEFAGSETYWLYHDNYLAAKVLRRTEPAVADRIEAAMRGYGVTGSGKIEIVTGEAERPLPFRDYELKEVARRGSKVIKTEIVTDRPLAGWEQYADLLFLAAMATSKEDGDEAKRLFAAGAKTWDGKGFADRVVGVNGIYATFKLALALIARQAIGAEFEAAEDVRKRLLAMQNEQGGWVTDYRPDLTPVGVANVETTSLAVMAVEARRS